MVVKILAIILYLLFYYVYCEYYRTPPIVLVNRCLILPRDSNSEVLLVKRANGDNHNAGLWEFPGGKHEKDQDIDASLKREVLEETGLQIETLSALAYTDSHIITNGKYNGMPYLSLFYIGRMLCGDLKTDPLEHEAAAWSPHDNVTQYDLTPESQRAWEKWQPMLDVILESQS